MIARQIQARFWDDEFVQDATWQSKYVFMYLLTCLPVNMCGVFQLTDKKIIFETTLSMENFAIGKEELSRNKKVLFFKGWVFVVNAFKNCKVWKSPKCWDAWEREWSKVNKDARIFFDTTMGTDIYTEQSTEISKEKALPKNQKPENKKNKTESMNQKGEEIDLDEIEI